MIAVDNYFLKRMWKTRAWVAGTGVILGMLGMAATSHAQQDLDFDDIEIGVWPVQGNIYMLVGAGGNITVQVGDDGVLIVDTMYGELSEKVLAAIREFSDGPIRHIINTHAHPDHTGGNAAIAVAGESISTNLDHAAVLAHENVLIDMLSQDPRPPVEAQPTRPYFTDSKDFFFNGEAVFLLHQPNAHTDGDSIVHFRRSDVISAGDIFSTTGYPFIDVKNGGSIQGIIDALNRIIDIAVPAYLQEGGTRVIPGHGRLCDESEVVEYRDMLTIIRGDIQEMINEGRSLRQVQSARPTLGYDVRYGSDSGSFTTEQFVEAIYRELIGDQDT